MFVCVCMGGDSIMVNSISMAANLFFTKSVYVFTCFPTFVFSFGSMCVHNVTPEGILHQYACEEFTSPADLFASLQKNDCLTGKQRGSCKSSCAPFPTSASTSPQALGAASREVNPLP